MFVVLVTSAVLPSGIAVKLIDKDGGGWRFVLACKYAIGLTLSLSLSFTRSLSRSHVDNFLSCDYTQLINAIIYNLIRLINNNCVHVHWQIDLLRSTVAYLITICCWPF